ncbi:MAG TPA: 4-hydroxy-3-methylbut-2-enyl diphosphate reductase [Candidatus Alistipes intestinipullorum]|nr:4-hydroxy-3-methylbut-2-enyl diphosphate reductase [Candidatus Alistipes intestinipullorum]
MKIEIDDKSGCCFGVMRAISKAEEALGEGGTVYSLGDIVHNRIEVQRLERLGLQTVTHDDMPRLAGCRLFIRAHGEPPTTYAEAQRLGIEVIDATCPVVARLQRRVVQAYERMQPLGGQVVILGKRGHAEVVGLTGQVEGRAIVIEGGDDLGLIDFTRPIHFLAQTTQSIELFEALGVEMCRRAADPGQVHIEDTICRQVSGREEHLAEFSGRFDVVLFVCGRKSSNGKVLSEVCRRANPRTHVVEEAAEIDPEWIAGAESIGICGATSTPKWLMQKVADAVESISETHNDNQSQQIRP